MIEAPENVYPHNCAIYIDKTMEEGEYTNPEIASFTFNGDNLSFARTEYYLADTNAVNHYSVIPKELVPWSGRYRRGDTFFYKMTTAAEFCENGLDYMYRYILFESNEDGTPKCSMKALAGHITSASGTRVFVEKNISDIDAPYIENDYLIGCCKIKIYGADSNGKYNQLNFIKINSYDPATGEIILDSSLSGAFKEGDRYEIYRNYYKTPMYFFKARKRASLTLSVQKDENYGTIKCSSDYSVSDNDNVSLMYYNWELSYADRKIAASSDIYSYHYKGNFPNNGSENVSLNHDFPYLPNKAFTVSCNAVSQDGAVSSKSYTMQNTVTVQSDCTSFINPREGNINVNGYLLKYSGGLAVDNEKRCVRISFTKLVEADRYTIFRRNITAGESEYRYVSSRPASSSNTFYNTFYDHLVDEGSEYEYVIFSSGNTAYIIGRITVQFIPSCVITGLKALSTTYFGLTAFDDSQSWHLDFEISDPELLIHSRKQQIQTQSFPLSSRAGKEFLTTDFSAAITAFKAAGFRGELQDTAANIESFREFISSYDAYLLKLPDTPCMLVDISGDVKLKRNRAGLTVCSFSFTEISNSDEIFIR
jgi:hypothetical protein